MKIGGTREQEHNNKIYWTSTTIACKNKNAILYIYMLVTFILIYLRLIAKLFSLMLITLERPFLILINEVFYVRPNVERDINCVCCFKDFNTLNTINSTQMQHQMSYKIILLGCDEPSDIFKYVQMRPTGKNVNVKL